MKNIFLITVTATLMSCNSSQVTQDDLDSTQTNSSSNLIQDCPDEKVINSMPGLNSKEVYYVYKGERREIEEFDAEWLKKSCTIKVTEVF